MQKSQIIHIQIIFLTSSNSSGSLPLDWQHQGQMYIAMHSQIDILTAAILVQKTLSIMNKPNGIPKRKIKKEKKIR